MNSLERRVAKLEREAPDQDAGAEADREAMRAEIAEMLARGVEPAIRKAEQEGARLKALSVDELVQEMREWEVQESSRHPTKEPDIRQDLIHMERYPIVWAFFDRLGIEHSDDCRKEMHGILKGERFVARILGLPAVISARA